MPTAAHVDFYFRPTCPWAWRTALWIRQVAGRGLVEVDWKLFSLHVINRGHDYSPDGHAFGYKAEILLMAARRHGGNPAVEKLYMALGDALHGRREERSDTLLAGALIAAGLPETLYADSVTDPTYEQELLAEHQQAVDELGAFGVPTLRLPGSKVAFFGPVVDPVPVGTAAIELWEHVQWSLRQPYLYELKRERTQKLTPLGLSQVGESIEPAGIGAPSH
jgi:2-hydroxychromene-2-carboxylate isomerase